MVLSTAIPWYKAPARPFPAKAWLQGRYWFQLPKLVATPPAAPVITPPLRRPFPAKVWLVRAPASIATLPP